MCVRWGPVESPRAHAAVAPQKGFGWPPPHSFSSCQTVRFRLALYRGPGKVGLNIEISSSLLRDNVQIVYQKQHGKPPRPCPALSPSGAQQNVGSNYAVHTFLVRFSSISEFGVSPSEYKTNADGGSIPRKIPHNAFQHSFRHLRPGSVCY
jgi:hypothetical protein